MKRWVVILLIVLAVVVLISPGIVGRLAEKNIEENITWAEDENPGVLVTRESFDRGWFTSEGRHRVTFSEGAFRATDDPANDDSESPALIIDTRIDHGLLPVTSLSRDAGSFLPGLANTISTFKIDAGSGQLIDVPGSLYSNVGLTGASSSRFVLEAGSFSDGNLSGEWQGVDFSIDSNPASGSYSVVGNSEPFQFSQPGQTMRFGHINLDVAQARSDYGFNVGTVEMAMGLIEVESEVTPFRLGSLSFTAYSSIQDKQLNADSRFNATEITAPGLEDLELAVNIAVDRLDAASLGVIIQAVKNAQDAPDPQAELQLLYPRIEQEVQKLIASGGEIRFDRLDVSLPQGTLESILKIEFGELDDDAQFSWPAALLAMTATLDLRIPEELYDYAIVMSPDIGTLVAMGVLIKDGDDYVMDAEYAQGLLNVNGAPMPVPLLGM